MRQPRGCRAKSHRRHLADTRHSISLIFHGKHFETRRRTGNLRGATKQQSNLKGPPLAFHRQLALRSVSIIGIGVGFRREMMTRSRTPEPCIKGTQLNSSSFLASGSLISKATQIMRRWSRAVSCRVFGARNAWHDGSRRLASGPPSAISCSSSQRTTERPTDRPTSSRCRMGSEPTNRSADSESRRAESGTN
jgi:hypothetical protein